MDAFTALTTLGSLNSLTGITGGLQGPQGNQGAAGPQGNQGFQGNNGAAGNQGSQGNQGNSGSQGNQGNQGAGLNATQTVYSETFESYSNATPMTPTAYTWYQYSTDIGAFTAVTGMYGNVVCSSGSWAGGFQYNPGRHWTDYTFECDVQAYASSRFIIGFRQSFLGGYWLQCLPGTQSHLFTGTADFISTQAVIDSQDTNVPSPITHVKIVLSGSSIKVYYNGSASPWHNITNTTYTTGTIAFSAYTSGWQMDNITVVNVPDSYTYYNQPFMTPLYSAAYISGGTDATAVAATWAAVTNGSFKLSLNGGVVFAVTGINFTGATTMAGVATIIQTALRAVTHRTETVVWNVSHFVITSDNITVATYVSFTTAGGAGTDISGIAGGSRFMSCNSAGVAAYQGGPAYTFTTSDSGKAVSSFGAVFNVSYGLPRSAIGLNYTLFAGSAIPTAFVKVSGDTIWAGALVGSTTGLYSSTAGASMVLIGTDNNHWTATTVLGTWTAY